MSDKQISEDMMCFLAERCSQVIAEVREKNNEYHKLYYTVYGKMDKLISKADEQLHYDIKNLVRLYMYKSAFEQQYMYLQGIKDSVNLHHHLEGCLFAQTFSIIEYDIENIDDII